MSKQEQTFHVDGMTCASCAVFLEEKLKGQAGVENVHADLGTCAVRVTGKFQENPEVLATKLSEAVAEGGYRLRVEGGVQKQSNRDFFIAIPAAALIIIAFLLLQELGLIDVVHFDHVSFGAAFGVGMIASMSTCLAVVGGLVLSMSATAAKNHAPRQTQVFFHVGRLGGFFVLGGVIGSLGQLFQLGLVGGAILSLAVALFMLLLGVNLVDIFPGLKTWQARFANPVARQTVRASSSTRLLAPLFVGIGTFFLPCGFTQSMQVYTLTTGSFLVGGLTMLSFALGTLPVLGLLSFGSFQMENKSWKFVFLKTAGLVIIVLSLYNVWNALRVLNVV